MTMPAAATQPVWTPDGVETVIKAVAYVLIPAVALVLIPAVVSVIYAVRAKTQSHATQQQVDGLQQQVTTVAMNQTPPAAPPAPSHVEWVPAIPPTDRPKGT
jgi:hypothetical protein